MENDSGKPETTVRYSRTGSTTVRTCWLCHRGYCSDLAVDAIDRVWRNLHAGLACLEIPLPVYWSLTTHVVSLSCSLHIKICTSLNSKGGRHRSRPAEHRSALIRASFTISNVRSSAASYPRLESSSSNMCPRTVLE